MSQTYEHFGKYILLEKIATGGMAEVWLSRATQAGGITKFVAVKKILPQYSDNPEFIQMFKDEAAIAMNLSHSNIVSIYGYDQDHGQLYLVMDYVEGRNLRQILNKMKNSPHKFAISQIVYVVKEIAAGLDHAHRSLNSATGKPLNITHRDMSPQNCMVSFEGEVKIVDFGIAKAESQVENTKTGTLKGKFGYMSPEQAEGQQTDLRTDVFSLGIVLWELLANDRLFIANNEINTLRKIRECQVPSLSKINPNIHPELERITNKALTRDRNLRYQTAAAMHRDLSRFLNKHDPEFTPHDFAVFIKTLYTDEILDARRKMVEYSKIPSRNEMGKQQNFEADKTQVTSFPQNTDASSPGDGSQIGQANTQTHTQTETGTFTGAHNNQTLSRSAMLKGAVPDEDKTEVSQEHVAATNEYRDPTVVGRPQGMVTNQATGSISQNTSATATKGVGGKSEVLNLEAINKTLAEPLKVQPRKVFENVNAEPVSGVYDMNELRQPITGQRPSSNQNRQRASKRPKESSSAASFIVFVAFAIGTYVLVSNFYPKETVKFETYVKGVLDGVSSSSSLKDLISKTSQKKPEPKKAPSVQSVNVPDFLRDDETKGDAAEAQIPTTMIVVQSSPSGAEIYVDMGMGFKNTGQTTPSRVDVPSDRPFAVRLKKFRHFDFEQGNILASNINRKFEATLTRQQTSYIDIVVKPTSNDLKVYVNNVLLDDDSLPVTRYAIPSNTDVKVRVESPTRNISSEKTVKLKEDERQTVELSLQK